MAALSPPVPQLVMYTLLWSPTGAVESGKPPQFAATLHIWLPLLSNEITLFEIENRLRPKTGRITVTKQKLALLPNSRWMRRYGHNSL
jgi:hypothetical protein